MGFLSPLIGAVLPLATLGVVIWLIVGAPGRKGDRVEANKHRGGRKAKDKSRWRVPARDRAWRPGILIMPVAVVELARVVVDSGTQSGTTAGWNAFWLGLIIAIGFAIRADIVSAGMGLIGIVTLFLGRYGGLVCRTPASDADNQTWVVISIGVIISVALLRFLVLRTRSGHRTPWTPLPSWFSTGPDEGAGLVGGTLLGIFGLMELTNLYFDPSTAEVFAFFGESVGLTIFISALVILVVGMALIPEFTLSTVGLGVITAEVLSYLLSPQVCGNIVIMASVAMAFTVAALAAKRFV